MKKILQPVIAIISTSLFLFSCSSSNFSKQKYTDFKNGDGQSKNYETSKSQTDTKSKISNFSFEKEEQEIKITLPKDKKEDPVTEKSNSETRLMEPFLDQTHENSDLRKNTSENKFQGFKRKMINSLKGGDDSDYGFLALVIMILLCIFLPPIAVLIADGIKAPFWLDLILAILGGWLYFGPNPILGLCYLLAVIYAFIIVF